MNMDYRNDRAVPDDLCCITNRNESMERRASVAELSMKTNEIMRSCIEMIISIKGGIGMNEAKGNPPERPENLMDNAAQNLNFVNVIQQGLIEIREAMLG